MAKKKNAKGLLKKSFTFQGKRIYVYGHNQAELFEKEKQKREQLENNYASRRNPTLQEFFNEWITEKEKDVIDSTIGTYTSMFKVMFSIKMELIPCNFGEIRILDVCTNDLIHVKKELRKTHSSATTNTYMGYLKHFFREAQRNGILKDIPYIDLKSCRREEKAARDTIHRALSREEQDLFFSSPLVKNSVYYNMYKLAVLSGMRCGELGALKYSDIKNGMIHVSRTLTTNKENKLIIGKDTKTRAGTRSIPITSEIKETLEAQKEFNRYYEGIIPMDGLIFRSAEGKLVREGVVNKELKRICKKLNMQPFATHAFRATFATRCIENGMNVKTLQEILGHANFNLTMSLYVHVLDETKIKEMNNISIFKAQ